MALRGQKYSRAELFQEICEINLCFLGGGVKEGVMFPDKLEEILTMLSGLFYYKIDCTAHGLHYLNFDREKSQGCNW